MEAETVDIAIVGAGLSGINTAYRVKTELPHRTYAVLESRFEIGGTWAFWKYPGIRTDSAMGLFGFPWRPWPYDANMADGPAIKAYMEECAAAEEIDKNIRFGHRVTSARWSDDESRWILQVEVSTREGDIVERKVLKAWWLISASGYYRYDKPLPAVIPGIDQFAGEVVHPQFWNKNVDHAGKRIVIIGSGATAVTLLPALAKTAKSVTILQRSPSYVFSLPRRDGVVTFLSRFMPRSWAATIHWWQRMIVETLFVNLLLAFPGFGRWLLTAAMRRQLPAGFDVATHFSPRYNPFEQRLCFCPGGDFFNALHRPNARIVTDTIDSVTPTGIRLASGAVLDADMIVTATGLYFQLFSGVDITVDSASDSASGLDPDVNASIADRYAWNGAMLEGVPNAGLIIGYTAFTWTPGADIRVRQLIKVIRHMEKLGAAEARPTVGAEERRRLEKRARPAVSLSSTYMVSAHKRMPRVAGVAPWVNGESWLGDVWRLVWGSVERGMRYRGVKEKDV
ncbi:hypothetical protein VTK26DRAFT_1318 [Humicola hyalothermophila]